MFSNGPLSMSTGIFKLYYTLLNKNKKTKKNNCYPEGKMSDEKEKSRYLVQRSHLENYEHEFQYNFYDFIMKQVSSLTVENKSFSKYSVSTYQVPEIVFPGRAPQRRDRKVKD